jgi:Protein of unknown function (DUF2628)
MRNIKSSREQLQAIWTDTTWEDIATYIGPNAERFRTAWEKQRAAILKKGHGITWGFCWPVFFLSYVWFFYRKQWLIGAMLIVVPIVIAFLFPTAEGGFGGLAIVIAMMAKSLYLQDVVPKVAKIRAAETGGVAREAVLAVSGGTSKLSGIISGVFFAISIVAVILPLMNKH